MPHPRAEHLKFILFFVLTISLIFVSSQTIFCPFCSHKTFLKKEASFKWYSYPYHLINPQLCYFTNLNMLYIHQCKLLNTFLEFQTTFITCYILHTINIIESETIQISDQVSRYIYNRIWKPQNVVTLVVGIGSKTPRSKLDQCTA